VFFSLIHISRESVLVTFDTLSCDHRVTKIVLYVVRLKMILRQFIILLLLIHLSRALFEDCDVNFELTNDNPVTINSKKFSLSTRNISSCRFTLTAPSDFIVEVKCKLRMDQLNSTKCPMKRFFISTEGIRELHNAEYFCNRNGIVRTVRRQSEMNRMVLAYVTQTNVTNETFMCKVKRVQSTCDCGWSKKVRKKYNFFEIFTLYKTQTFDL
jgi:hypothetical protein